MALPISITLTLIIAYITFFLKKKFSFVHNAIIFLIMAIIEKNYITIMNLELKILKTTEDPFLFLFLLLHREIIIPLLLVIFLNVLLRLNTLGQKILHFIFIAGFMQLTDILSTYFKVVEFIKWNMFYELLVNISFLFIGIGISKFLVVISKGEGIHHDRNL
jgi:hypothetical protein